MGEHEVTPPRAIQRDAVQRVATVQPLEHIGRVDLRIHGQRDQAVLAVAALLAQQIPFARAGLAVVMS
jgi:hypothetical protein